VTATASPERRRQLRDVLEHVWADLPQAAPGALVTGALALPLPAGPALLGRDGTSLPHLLLPVAVPPRLDLRFAGVRVQVRTLTIGNHPQHFVDLACLRDGLARVFLSLAVDVCAGLAADPTDPGTTVGRVVDEWRALLAPGGTNWSRARCAGLFGELMILLRLLDADPGAAAWWTGPAGEAHDFRTGAAAIEVKTTLGAEGRLITVHGWDQLEVPAGGALHLVWLRVREADAPAGVSVREMILRARAATAHPSAFDSRVSLLALPAPPDPEIDRRCFVPQEERWYAVNDKFPRIVPSSFVAGAVPGGIADLSYRIDLDTVRATGDPDAALRAFLAG
jgi:hypothetical protein